MDARLWYDGGKALEVELQFLQKGKDVDRSVLKKAFSITMCILFFFHLKSGSIVACMERGVRGARAVHGQAARMVARSGRKQAVSYPLVVID